jgi:DNA polymerase-1
MELRVLAHYSREPRLLEAFELGRDIHLETASEVFNKESRKVTKDERYLAKTVNFSIIYGSGPYGLAANAKIPVPQAAQLIERYMARLPKVQKFIHRTHRECLVNGQVRSLFGRVRRIPIREVESKEGQRALRQSVNFKIQDTAASICDSIMCDIHAILRRGMHSRIIGTVHDSHVFDAYNEELTELFMIIEEVWDRPNLSRYGVKFTVPLKVDISFGPNWRDLKGLPSGS